VNGAVARAAPPGSTIGVVTPGSPPETRAEVQRGIGWWESKGYRVKLMPGALEEDGWHAGSPEVRASDLQAAFADPDVDAIQTMRGGYGSAQVIPLLDFDAIAETPKAFVGLSDITALHAALLVRSRLTTFYGPSLTMFGSPSPSPFTADRLLQVLAGETTGPVPEDHDRLTVISIAAGRASGRLVGGCLVDFMENLQAVSGTNTPPRRGRRPWRTCSTTASADSASPCSTGCPWDTARASPRFRSASKRQSTRTRSRSRSMSPRS